MTFPLGDWILSHSNVPHNLARSGMAGQLSGTAWALRHPVPDDGQALRVRLAHLHDVRRQRVFLTHGATEGNSLAMLFLQRESREASGHAPRFRITAPEYPPIADTARDVGYRLVGEDETAEVTALSYPNNPTGHLPSRLELHRRIDECRWVVADETYREFTSASTLLRAEIDGLWVTGTFTKLYGADSIRVGFVIVPEKIRDRFDLFHSLVLNEPAAHSVGVAHAILNQRRAILREARELFRRNHAILHRAVPDTMELAAPLWFDQGPHGFDGDGLARRALRSGVLVCPGSFFGEPRGVRVCLTQRSFSKDLARYLDVRQDTL